MNLGCAFQLPKTSNAVAFHGLTTGCLRRAVPFVMAGNRYGCKEKKRPPYRKVISRNEDVKKWRKFTVQSRDRGLQDRERRGNYCFAVFLCYEREFIGKAF